MLFAVFKPETAIGRISLYNTILPGRVRLPYGDEPSQSYNLSLNSLDAMFASHVVSRGTKPDDEFRVLLIGDSSTWGYLLPADQTLSASLNGAGLRLTDGRIVRVFNLGYPVMSLAKDAMILSQAMQYDPDLIVWLVTLESFPYDKQLFPPLLQHNPEVMRNLIQKYDLRLDPADPEFVNQTWWQRTFIGSRRELADWFRLQVLGVMWAATGIDQDIPKSFPQRLEDLPADGSFHNLLPPHLTQGDLAIDILSAGYNIAAGTPLLLINEPMFISQGKNSDIRYNFYYPRWAYDDYRQILARISDENHWVYLDLWDAVPPGEFTNTAVHLSAEGTELLANLIAPAILNLAEDQP